LGEVPCATEGPGLKRYVATLIDRDYGDAGAGGAAAFAAANAGGDATGFEAPSSLPTPCFTAVGFGFVVPGRQYQVLIDGYDTDQITPQVTGSPRMLATTTPEGELEAPLVKPRWHTECPRTSGVEATIVRASGCQPFKAETGPSSVRIPLGKLLGKLSCGTEAGQVDSFNVTLTIGETEQALTGIPCGSDAEAIFADVTPRTLATAYVSAFAADGSDAFAGATCNAVAVVAAGVDANCSLLSTLGTLRVDLPSALEQLGVSCDSADVAAVSVKLPGEDQAQSVAPPACLHPFDHGFAAGPAIVTLSVTKAVGDVVSLSCHAEVAPGKLVVAECEQQ
jgi:hypothetical protein